jgi:hypothetical protein
MVKDLTVSHASSAERTNSTAKITSTTTASYTHDPTAVTAVLSLSLLQSLSLSKRSEAGSEERPQSPRLLRSGAQNTKPVIHCLALPTFTLLMDISWPGTLLENSVSRHWRNNKNREEPSPKGATYMRHAEQDPRTHST